MDLRIAVAVSLVGLQMLASSNTGLAAERGRQFSANGPGGVIADGVGSKTPGAPFRSTIRVPRAFAGGISNVWVELHGFEHLWPGDLTARLIHPSGRSIDLFNRPGRGTDLGAGPGVQPNSSVWGFWSDFLASNQYSFADNATVLFNPVFGGDPYDGWQSSGTIRSGIYRPTSNPNSPRSNGHMYAYTPVSFFTAFGGKFAAGEWTLEIIDWGEGEVGTLAGWTLNICTGGCPAAPRSVGDEILKITAFTPEVNSDFGGFADSLSVSRNLLAVGAGNRAQYPPTGRGHSGTGEPEFGAGSVHLFDLKTGRETAMISPKDLTEGSRFGTSVGVSRGLLIAGAYGDLAGATGIKPSGSAYIYDVRDPERPIRIHKLRPAGATGSERWNFGISVAISGSLGIVGALIEGQNNVLDASGTVFLFDLTTGEELARMTAPTSSPAMASAGSSRSTAARLSSGRRRSDSARIQPTAEAQVRRTSST